MFHKSKLGEHGETFPHDVKGHVPVHQDCWRKMQFEHDDMDPEEEGISEEEKARRIEYLDTVWWPKILENVTEERERLVSEHGETFMQKWEGIIQHTTDTTQS